MKLTPVDILNYVINNDLEYMFMNALAYHKQGYSIGEITDRKYIIKDEICRIKSESYSINVPITDDEICAALRCGMYVSAFICRYNDNYQLHFFVHKNLASEKSEYDEDITKEVVQYMIIRTIIALKLDSYEKINEYIGKSTNIK